ncbi:hypothetical protein AMJ57_01450 [Parcubacteria bacterium SG8_24]|nr:MAG: hypothetical protein AMJ57_01450 [Parcubacteria bacterium SG8_24]
MRTAVIVPAYNEERTVGAVVRSLAADGHEVIVVDDGSADRTGEAARRAGARVIRHVLNRGLGAAIGTGVAAALRGPAEVLVTFDADGQHRSEDIPRLVGPIGCDEADVTIGTRSEKRHRMPLTRRLANWTGNALTFLLFGKWVNDSQSGLRAFSRPAAEDLELRCDRMEVSSEIIKEIKRHGWRLVEVPIVPIYTEYSMSKGQGFVTGLKTAIRLLLRRVAK